jgi:hypothetical protein
MSKYRSSLGKKTSNDLRLTSNHESETKALLDDFEDRPLAMARGRTGEQRTNSLNGLAAPANNATDVSSAKLQLKDRGSAAWNFRQDNVVGKFNQLANDELEELSHAPERLITNAPSHNSRGATGNTNEHEFRLSQIPALWRIGFPQQVRIAGCDSRERTAVEQMQLC